MPGALSNALGDSPATSPDQPVTVNQGPSAIPPQSQGPDVAAPDLPAQPQEDLSGLTQAPTSLPKFERTFSNTLKSLLIGFGMGGVPGAVVGAADPVGIARAQANSRAIAQAKVSAAQGNATFENARAAHEVAMAHQADLEYQSLPEKLQQEQEKRSFDTLTSAKAAGYLPISSIPLDQGTDQNSQAAMTALQDIKSRFGTVPAGLVYIHTGNTMTVLKLNDPNAALPMINQTLMAQGQKQLDANTFAALSQADKETMARNAINFTNPLDPVNGEISQNSLNIANLRLLTVKAQPAFNGQDALVSQLQATIDHQQSVLDSGTGAAAIRAGKAKGLTAQAAQPGETAAKVAEINATAGPEAAAAGQKAFATAKGQAAAGGEEGPEWKPKVTADEKKKAELAENIAFNANEVNGILARRPDLVGAVAGRFTNAEQMVGNNDPDISALGTHIHNLAMANNGVHGMRSGEMVTAFEHQVLNNFHNGPQAVKGALDASVGSVQTFIDNARPSSYKTSSGKGGAGSFFAKQGPTGGTSPFNPKTDFKPIGGGR